MERVCIGSEAVAVGLVTPYQLGRHYRRLLPDVYAPRQLQLTVHDRLTAAWLWSRRRGVVTGVSASALHGARWVSADTPVELNFANNKSPAGVITRSEVLADVEVEVIRGLPVTPIARTAFDLARRGTVRESVARLDALACATNFAVADVLGFAEAHPSVRGCRRIPEVLGLVDHGAQSPKETWLRLLLIEAGFPRPRTQIPLLGDDGRPRYYLDMGWKAHTVAVEYDGQQHRTDPAQYRWDVTRSERIAEMGWRRIAVLAGDRGPGIIDRVERAGVPRIDSDLTRRLTRTLSA